jgi:hypothetical protein
MYIEILRKITVQLNSFTLFQYSNSTNFQLAMFIVTGLLVIELVIFAFTPEMGMYAYGVMMVVIYFTFPGTQALLPSCTAQTFGPTFTSSNYGMIYWAPVSEI